MTKSTKPQYISHFITSDGHVISLIFANNFYQIKEDERKILLISSELKKAQADYQQIKSLRKPDLSPGEVDQLADKRTSIKSD